MKKIVALVLSLVMVLGLATTAMAADWGTIEYDLYKANDDDAWKQVVVKVFDAENEDGAGNIEYFKLKDLASDAVFPDEFVECKRAEAEYFLTLKDNDGVYKYLKTADYVEYNYTGKAFTNIGDECGQIDVTAKDKVYVAEVDDEGTMAFFKKTAGTAAYVLMVDGVLVPVVDAGYPIDHEWVVTAYNADEEPTTAKCSECDATAKLYKTKLAAPVGATIEVQTVAGYYVVVDKAPVADEKVESAETFDAGIAMYVGMSVMAAAGSAVVLKKKD